MGRVNSGSCNAWIKNWPTNNRAREVITAASRLTARLEMSIVTVMENELMARATPSEQITYATTSAGSFWNFPWKKNPKAKPVSSDAKVRTQEGMERVKGFIGEPFDTLVEIVENGVKYQVDVKDGQKTGFFLDQKYNRLAIQKLCKGARVLDCFTHTGSFALNAGIAGAAEVTGVDASELAVHQAGENAKLNGLEDRVKFICEDVFELLPELEKKGEKYDVVILDPPAFTKSRNSIKNAVRGYREINLRAMKLVKDRGFLATCSCSHFMDYELFTQTIGQAARNAHKRLRQVEFRTQAADHPILWGAGDSYYLKFYIFQVCEE